MSETQSYANVKVGSERSFGFVFSVVFTLIGLFPMIDGDGEVRVGAIAVGAVFGVLALALPKTLRPLNIVWFKFGMLLGRVIAPIVMALVFFVAVTPVALLMRLFGKDPLKKKLDPKAESYWIKRDDDETPMGPMTNQF